MRGGSIKHNHCLFFVLLMRVQNVVLAEGEYWRRFFNHFPGFHPSCCFSWQWFRHLKVWDGQLNEFHFLNHFLLPSHFYPFSVDVGWNIKRCQVWSPNVLRLLQKSVFSLKGHKWQTLYQRIRKQVYCIRFTSSLGGLDEIILPHFLDKPLWVWLSKYADF